MAGSRLNALDQALDIAGSLNHQSNLNLLDEPAGLGLPLTGQTGNTASVSVINASDVTITGLTGMTADSVGHFLQMQNDTNSNNNGIFYIDTYISATSVTVVNPNAVVDGYAQITWTERYPYSLLEDLNFERTDRTLIKGVPYYDPIPVYQRPDAIGTFVPANLTNISTKTTDAVAYNVNRAFFGVPTNPGDTKETITAVGMLKHSNTVDQTGIPCFDAAPFTGDWVSCYVHVVDGYSTGSELTVLGGPHAGERIIGITYNGASTSPNSVEVHFYSAPFNVNYALDATPYVWESGQTTSVNLLYGYNERLDMLDQNAFRSVPALGILTDAQLSGDINNILSVLGTTNVDTSLNGLISNLTQYFPFYYLNATPTVAEALNILNQQIGNTTFTGPTFLVNGDTVTQNLQFISSNTGPNIGYTGGNITDGYTFTQSIQYLNETIGYYGNFTGGVLQDGYSISQNLQQLANSIANSTVTRTIERLVADVPANTDHTLPGGLTYQLDGTNNGQYMFVFTRGILRDPGPASGNNDYLETSTTQIKFYTKVKSGDHINYLIK